MEMVFIPAKKHVISLLFWKYKAISIYLLTFLILVRQGGQCIFHISLCSKEKHVQAHGGSPHGWQHESEWQRLW